MWGGREARKNIRTGSFQTPAGASVGPGENFDGKSDTFKKEKLC